MSENDLVCPICKRIGQNVIAYFAVNNHPNLEEEWYVCKCGHAIKEVEE